MPHPLENTWLKLDRADKHLRELKRKIDAFASRDPYYFRKYDDLEHGYYIYRIEATRNPPRSWGPIMGDAIHNLRSSLDHLAWQLARLKVSSPSKNTAFPIFDSWDKDSPKRFAKIVRQMPDAAKGIIKEIQPHNHRELATKHPLAILSYLSNVDKHRLIIPTGTIVNIPTRNIPGASLVRLNEREIEARVPRNIDTEVDFEPNISFQVAINVPAFRETGGLDFYRLRDIGQFIREDVIPRFAGFFPPR